MLRVKNAWWTFGGNVLVVALVFVTALIVALLKDRGGTTSTGAMALSTVAAFLVLIWVVRIGHSGAQAVWSGVVRKH